MACSIKIKNDLNFVPLLQVELNLQQEELDSAISSEDFLKAQQVKQVINDLKDRKRSLEEEIEKVSCLPK